jgi:hypothetical protein
MTDFQWTHEVQFKNGSSQYLKNCGPVSYVDQDGFIKVAALNGGAWLCAAEVVSIVSSKESQ